MPNKMKIYHKEGDVAEVDAVDGTRYLADPKISQEWAAKPWPKAKADTAKTTAPAFAPVITYAIKDNGDGTFSVVDDSGAVIVASVTADEAKEFDAKSDADKAAFVKAKTASS